MHIVKAKSELDEELESLAVEAAAVIQEQEAAFLAWMEAAKGLQRGLRRNGSSDRFWLAWLRKATKDVTDALDRIQSASVGLQFCSLNAERAGIMALGDMEVAADEYC
jgi:hypothetical protein